MLEVNLTNKDYEVIMDEAVRLFKNESIGFQDNTFLCRCYFGAVVGYINKNNLIVKDGKIYKNE